MYYQYMAFANLPVDAFNASINQFGEQGWHVLNVFRVPPTNGPMNEPRFDVILERKRDLKGEVQ